MKTFVKIICLLALGAAGFWTVGWLISELVEVYTGEEYAFSNLTYIWTGAFAAIFMPVNTDRG